MKHVKVTPPLRSLHTILKEWVRLNTNLGRQWSKTGNLPWWYNERALLSIFAGAIWRKNGHVFEEFSEMKLGRVDKKEANGRVDLWFETSGGEFRAEAKHALIPITNKSKQQNSLNALMKRAVADAGCNPPDGGESRRLAIAFAVPYIVAKTTREKHQKQIKWFIEMAKAVDYDAIAWVFPNLKKLPAPDGWACPGIVIFIKEVKRSSV